MNTTPSASLDLAPSPHLSMFAILVLYSHLLFLPSILMVTMYPTSAGLAVLGSRKKESLCMKVDKALGEMMMLVTPRSNGDDEDGDDLADGNANTMIPAAEDPTAVAAAKKAARTVITVLMSAYKFPEVIVE